MHNYNVVKFFGHFMQCWKIKAESDDDAWNRAERDGVIQAQSVYKEPKDLESKGYVVNLDDNKSNRAITNEEYTEWLKEAIEKGMIVTSHEYERAYGLPFHDVWR